jgi:hypothetical protein
MDATPDEISNHRRNIVLSEAEKYLWDYAILLRKHNRKQTFDELAAHLNALGYRHANGSIFHGGRSTAKFINDLYWKIEPFMGAEAAKPIAEAFTDASGEYSYDKEKPAEVTQEWLDEQQASWQRAI